MKIDQDIPVTMLAPCGLNCKVCYAHLRKKKPCVGCREPEGNKPEHCRKCAMKDCAAGQGVEFCFECPMFPCTRIKRLDKSYKQRYQVGLIENAIRLKTVGAKDHLHVEMQKWTCSECGGIVCLHNRVCSECGKAT